MTKQRCTNCEHHIKDLGQEPCMGCCNFDMWTPRRIDTLNLGPQAPTTPEYTGGSVSYYRVQITNPTSGTDAYQAECNDIIEALGMNYAEGNAFKAIWRKCAARTLGKAKAGYEDGLYDAEKVVFFGQRMVSQEKYHGG